MIGLYWFIWLVYVTGLKPIGPISIWMTFFCLLNEFATNEHEAFTDKKNEVKWNYNQQMTGGIEVSMPTLSG